MHSPEEPSMKMPRVEEEKGISLNKQPKWILEKILGGLSVTERLRMERVDWFWKGTMQEFGLTGLRELSYEVVFGGAVRVRQELFNNKSLLALFKRARKGSLALDLGSFKANRLPITEDVCASFNLLPDLSRIDIIGFMLLETVQFLPTNLREITTDGPFDQQSLSALAEKCPKLEAVYFAYNDPGIPAPVSVLNDFLRKCPSLKKLHLVCPFLEETGKLTAIGELKELEEFHIFYYAAPAFDEEIFRAMIENCKGLRRMSFYGQKQLSLGAYSHLTKLPNLVELKLFRSNISDSFVKKISKCPNLKILQINECGIITDASIVYLVKHCKSLVSVEVYKYSSITEKSLLAVMAEVNRRHGVPPKTLPKGPSDKGIFYFPCADTRIDMEIALEVTANNPWLTIGDDEALSARSF